MDVSPCITEKARVALLFIESENYILNDFRFLGCLSRSNNSLHITIHCNDCINTEFKTTQSPQRPTEVNLLFENVLITFVILFAMDICKGLDSPTRSDQPSIAAGIHTKVLNYSCHIFMYVNTPAYYVFLFRATNPFRFLRGIGFSNPFRYLRDIGFSNPFRFV